MGKYVWTIFFFFLVLLYGNLIQQQCIFGMHMYALINNFTEITVDSYAVVRKNTEISWALY